MWCADFAKIYWAISSSLMWKKPMLRDYLWSFCVLADSCKQNALLTSCYFSTIYFYFSKLCRLSAKEKEGNKSDRNWLPRSQRRRWAAMCLPFRGWGSCLVFFVGLSSAPLSKSSVSRDHSTVTDVDGSSVWRKSKKQKVQWFFFRLYGKRSWNKSWSFFVVQKLQGEENTIFEVN